MRERSTNDILNLNGIIIQKLDVARFRYPLKVSTVLWDKIKFGQKLGFDLKLVPFYEITKISTWPKIDVFFNGIKTLHSNPLLEWNFITTCKGTNDKYFYTPFNEFSPWNLIDWRMVPQSIILYLALSNTIQKMIDDDYRQVIKMWPIPKFSG